MNQDLDFKRNRYKTGLAIQTSFAACPPKQIIPRKAREAAFPHYIEKLEKINRTIDYEKDNENRGCRPSDGLWKLPVVIACTLFLHIH